MNWFRSQRRFLAVVCFICWTAFAPSPEAFANTTDGHTAIAAAILIRATREPEKYRALHIAAGAKLDENGKIVSSPLMLTGKQVRVRKNGRVVYDLDPDNLNDVQNAFVLGSISNDDTNEFLGGRTFQDYTHYIDSKGVIDSNFQLAAEQTDPTRRALFSMYAYGSLCHAASDLIMHPTLPQYRRGSKAKLSHVAREKLRDDALQKQLTKGREYDVDNDFGFSYKVENLVGMPKISNSPVKRIHSEALDRYRREVASTGDGETPRDFKHRKIYEQKNDGDFNWPKAGTYRATLDDFVAAATSAINRGGLEKNFDLDDGDVYDANPYGEDEEEPEPESDESTNPSNNSKNDGGVRVPPFFKLKPYQP